MEQHSELIVGFLEKKYANSSEQKHKEKETRQYSREIRSLSLEGASESFWGA